MTDITMTVGDLATGFEALAELASRKLKISPAFWIARQQRKLLLDYTSFTEKRLEQIKKFGAETPPGSGVWTVRPENGHVYGDAINELVKCELTVTVEPRPIAFLALEDVEPRLLAATWFLWTDEPPAGG